MSESNQIESEREKKKRQMKKNVKIKRRESVNSQKRKKNEIGVRCLYEIPHRE